MAHQNFILDDLEEDQETLGLIRAVKKIPEYEFIFAVNRINNFNFKRIKDLKYSGKYFDYNFSVYKGYDIEYKNCIHIFSNKSTSSLQKKEITELFVDEENERFLLNKYRDIDYIIKTTDDIHDFSLILLPKNIAFDVQKYIISSEEELYHLIQYYD
ncbi:IPExxxVDY family protein [Frigoriflavimonas asaccharolytica]|uniref:IPExxxVDY family protein n=1 Tax=Frigoriflavimonas asaccharolytica TaxID=2735899 RepID=A0A8J8K8S3_9FLAO|nr:IPExxxVDY family protein [Frigoriflavimonas asaccharolytica]NRS93198.1 hypothetical protein [Frigoriflavimonas asaccharolytica]